MKVLLVGATGAMGHVLQDAIVQRSEMEIVAGISHEEEKTSFPLYKDFSHIQEEADIIIDFSNAALTPKLLSYIEKTQIPAVIATTGLSKETKENIQCLSEKIPLFYTQNMSIGINIMSEVVEHLAKVLEDFDIEILEAHHNQKVDAPSGTAELLFHAVQRARPESYEIYDRSTQRQKRNPLEIGMSSLRGGTIVGEHTVFYCGEDEVLEVKHSAGSKKIFAQGAIKAAEFLIEQKPGLYTMKDVLHGSH